VINQRAVREVGAKPRGILMEANPALISMNDFSIKKESKKDGEISLVFAERMHG